MKGLDRVRLHVKNNRGGEAVFRIGEERLAAAAARWPAVAARAATVVDWDTDRFAEAFVEQLATYALRRVMTVDDKAAIKAIAAQSKPDEYRLRSILENLVLSDLFQKR